MTKEYIISVLRREEIVKEVSLLRTQFELQMTDFYFFRTFIEAFKKSGIETEIQHEVLPFSFTDKISKLDNQYCIRFYKDREYLSKRFRYDKLQNKLKEYNTIQGEMSMLESASALIDIFISLIE